MESTLKAVVIAQAQLINPVGLPALHVTFFRSSSCELRTALVEPERDVPWLRDLVEGLWLSVAGVSLDSRVLK